MVTFSWRLPSQNPATRSGGVLRFSSPQDNFLAECFEADDWRMISLDPPRQEPQKLRFLMTDTILARAREIIEKCRESSDITVGRCCIPLRGYAEVVPRSALPPPAGSIPHWQRSAWHEP